MNNIEPTEEQRAAARAWQDGVDQRVSGHPTLALFLAEREAKLRAQVDKLVTNTVHRDWLEACHERDRAKAIAKEALDQRDALRARVAELEADRVRDAAAMDARMQEHEAQHLADIKALRARLYCHEDEVMCSLDENSQPPCECTNCKLRRRTAHYDDAKAECTEGGEG